MKQKIVMRVQMNCEKCRIKAMEIAAGTEGVISIAVEGNDREKVVVIGDGVDAVILAKDMRKKVGPTDLLIVEEVKPKEEKNKPEVKPTDPIQWMHNYYHQYPQPMIYEQVYEDNSGCSIM